MKRIEFMSKNHTILLRAFAILIIILSHIVNGNISVFTPLGGIGVSIFLILSGYGLEESYKKNGLKNFWKKKFINVYLPFFVLNVVYFLLISIFPAICDKSVSFKDAILSLLFIKRYHGYFWYLEYLFICYFIFWAVNLSKADSKLRLIIFWVISIVGFFVFDDRQMVQQTGAFVLGITMSDGLKKLWQQLKDSRYIYGLLFLGLGVLAMCIKQIGAFRAMQDTLIFDFLQLCNKILPGFAIVLLSYPIVNKFNLNCFYGIGLASYELYLVHAYTTTYAQSYTVKGILIFIVATIIGTYLLNRLIRLQNKCFYKILNK